MYYDWNQTIHIYTTISKFQQLKLKAEIKMQFDFKLFKCVSDSCVSHLGVQSSKVIKKAVINQPFNLNIKVWGALHWAYIPNSWHVTFLWTLCRFLRSLGDRIAICCFTRTKILVLTTHQDAQRLVLFYLSFTIYCYIGIRFQLFPVVATSQVIWEYKLRFYTCSRLDSQTKSKSVWKKRWEIKMRKTRGQK